MVLRVGGALKENVKINSNCFEESVQNYLSTIGENDAQ